MKENQNLNDNYINLNNEFKNVKKLNDDYIKQSKELKKTPKSIIIKFNTFKYLIIIFQISIYLFI